jgi:molybdopterin molybdotransferase
MLLPCENIAEWWRTMAGLQDGGDFEDLEAEGDGGVKSDWWNKRWIPILEGPDGDLLCIDMDPDEGGVEGQVI